MGTFMTASSLTDLLHTPPDDSCPIAFGEHEVWTWGRFRQDVHATQQAVDAVMASSWTLCFRDAYHFSVALFALLHAGKKTIIPGNLQKDTLAEGMNDSMGCLHDDGVDTPFTKAIRLPLPAVAGPIPPFARVDLIDARLTLLTSGSSGEPKPVEKRWTDLDAEVQTLERVWGDQLGICSIVSTVSPQHIYGLLFRVLWPLCAYRPFDRDQLLYPEQVLSRAASQTVLISSPAMLKRLTERTTTPYRAVFSSGGALPYPAAQDTAQSLGVLPTEVFGSTETGGIGWRQQATTDVPWTLFPDLKARINDDGCLCILSPYMHPRAWYTTSDLCDLHDPRHFSWIGRMDRVVKIEEKRVSLTEVEKRLCQLQAIQDAAALPVSMDERLTLGALVVLSSTGRSQIDTLGKGRFWLKLRKDLCPWLEPAAVPRIFRVVEGIPLNSQGKRILRDLDHLFKAS